MPRLAVWFIAGFLVGELLTRMVTKLLGVRLVMETERALGYEPH